MSNVKVEIKREQTYTGSYITTTRYQVGNAVLFVKTANEESSSKLIIKHLNNRFQGHSGRTSQQETARVMSLFLSGDIAAAHEAVKSSYGAEALPR